VANISVEPTSLAEKGRRLPSVNEVDGKGEGLEIVWMSWLQLEFSRKIKYPAYKLPILTWIPAKAKTSPHFSPREKRSMVLAVFSSSKAKGGFQGNEATSARCLCAVVRLEAVSARSDEQSLFFSESSRSLASFLTGT
jgi:hypothetical protein